MLNPQNALLQQMTTSPLFKRAQEMAYGKSPNELEQIAKNICATKGVNYNEAVNAFKQMFGNNN